jgi:hypothetical protein
LGSNETTLRHRPAEPAGRGDQEGSATMAKLLEIQIAPDDLEFLKSNQYPAVLRQNGRKQQQPSHRLAVFQRLSAKQSL